MIGFVADDIGLTGGFGPAPTPTVATFETDAQRMYGEKSAAFLKLYSVSTDAEVAAAQKSAARDRVRVQMDLWAAEQLKFSKRIYTYYFDRVLPWPAHPEFGAFHTSEVPYVFQTIDKLDRPWEPTDRALSDTVSSYWTNFAKKGDPNGATLPTWPAYAAESHKTMQLGARNGTMDEAEAVKLDFWLSILKK